MKISTFKSYFKKFLTEEINKTEQPNNQEEASLEQIVDYLLSEEDNLQENKIKNYFEGMAAKDAINKAKIEHTGAVKKGNQSLADKIEMNLKNHLENIKYEWKRDPDALDIIDINETTMKESKGRTSSALTLKKNVPVEEVKTFLKKVQALIKRKSENSKVQGRKIKNNFTDEDIEVFANLLTKKEGFTRADLLKNISFFQGKPFQAAQKMMDILGERKYSTEIDKQGNPIMIGKGYIVPTGQKVDTKFNKRAKIKPDEDETELDDISLDDDSFDDNEPLNESLVKTLQARAGLLT